MSEGQHTSSRTGRRLAAPFLLALGLMATGCATASPGERPQRAVVLDGIAANFGGDDANSVGVAGSAVGIRLTGHPRGYGLQFGFGSAFLLSTITSSFDEGVMWHTDTFVEPRYFFGEPLQRVVPYVGGRLGVSLAFSELEDIAYGLTYGVNGGALIFLNPRFSVDVSAALLRRSVLWNEDFNIGIRQMQMGLGISYGW